MKKVNNKGKYSVDTWVSNRTGFSCPVGPRDRSPFIVPGQRDKGTTGQISFFVLGQMDNGTSQSLIGERAGPEF